jgi:hypothetical protein
MEQMKRNYSAGQQLNVAYFVGTEVEQTPAFGIKTLFVVGLQPVDEIRKHAEAEDCDHIFFGANHSFDPDEFNDWDTWKEWEEMISFFLDEKYLCSLDIPLSAVEEFHDSGLNDYHNFIPQIRIPIPYIKLWNYNTMLKIDDKTFDFSNPGVWVHRLHELRNHSNFTGWDNYSNDKVVK